MIDKNNQEKKGLSRTEYIQMETGKVNKNYFICIGNYNIYPDFWYERLGIKINKKKDNKIYFAYSHISTMGNFIDCPWLAFDNFKPRDIFTLGISYFIRQFTNITYTSQRSFIEKTKKTDTKDKKEIILFLKSIPNLIEGGIKYIEHTQKEDKNKIKELMNL